IDSDAFQRSPNPLAHLDVAGRPESIQVLEHRIHLFARGGVRVNDSVLPRSGNRHRRGLPAVTQPRAHLLHDHAHFHVPADPLPKLSGTKCEPIRFAWTARMEPHPTPNRRTDFARQPIATRGSAREAFFGAKRKMILPSVAGDVRKRLLGASWSLPIAAHHSFDVLGGYVRSCGLAWRREC